LKSANDDFAEAMAAAAERLEGLLADGEPPADAEKCLCGRRKLVGLTLCETCKIRADGAKRDAEEAAARKRTYARLRRRH
jgi:hypothetical protein